MKQRLGLAQTLLTQTRVLMLDEPFIGLDPLGKEILKKVIIQKAKEEQAGILFSSHDLNDVTEICDRVVMIEDGQKVYDDVFHNDRRHSVTVAGNTDITLLQALNNLFPGDISLNDNNIEFKSELLSKVMDFISHNNISVIDIQIKENSLYDFFQKKQGRNKDE